MGQKLARVKKEGITAKQKPFKIFEYTCQSCGSKRPIQYFYRNGVFVQQNPRVVCGSCDTSIMAEPFKAVDYCCPTCKKWRKVRLPAKPVPLNMYNVSIVRCQCGFHGETVVGKLMDVVCGACWTTTKELTGVWTENGDEIKSFCHHCQKQERAFARLPKKQAPADVADMEYTCDNCFRVRPLHAEEFLRNQGLAYCSLCGWVGYPEIRDRNKDKEDNGKKKAKASRPSVSDATGSDQQPPPRPKAGFGLGFGVPSESSDGVGRLSQARSASPHDLSVLPV